MGSYNCSFTLSSLFFICTESLHFDFSWLLSMSLVESNGVDVSCWGMTVHPSKERALETKRGADALFQDTTLPRANLAPVFFFFGAT